MASKHVIAGRRWRERTLEREQFGPPCWCGERRPYFASACEGLDSEPCGGLGTLHCYCGGDFCVCHWHGETECPGCEDCNPGLDFADDYDDYEHPLTAHQEAKNGH